MASIPLDRIKEIVEKIPTTALLVAYLGWLGFDYHAFMNEAGSPLNMKKIEVKVLQDETSKLRSRVKQANDFLKSLDIKRSEMRRLAQDLDDMKASLTESLDVPGFMKQILTEAQRVGLRVVSIKPGETGRFEYYAQQVFELSFRGVFIQLVGFLDRLSSLQKIVRADNFSIKPVSAATSKFVELEGTVQIKAFRYLGSKADDLLKSGGPKQGQALPAGQTGAPNESKPRGISE